MKLNIDNIGIIKKAEINFKGLTVIAGENDSGKSTISKSLFCIIKALNKPEELEVGIVGNIKTFYSFFNRVHLKVRRSIHEENSILQEFHEYRRHLSRLNLNVRKKRFDFEDIGLFEALFDNFEFLIQDLHDICPEVYYEFVDKWENLYFELNSKIDINLEAIRRAFFSEFNLEITNKFSNKEGSIRCSNRYGENLFSTNISNDIFSDLTEYGKLPYTDTIFIESPIVLNLYSALNSSNTIFESLKSTTNSLMRNRGIIPYHIDDLIVKLEISKIKNEYGNKINKNQEIENIISGKVSFSNKYNDFIFTKNRDEHEKVYKIMNTASGIKSFGIIQLLENGGFINEETLLIIDEPEVHLHPKWQLKYAEMIVKLVKLGVPILVTSHSPYFVQALKVYSDRENLFDKTSFYLTEKENEETVLIDTSDNLNKIFKKLAEPLEELVWGGAQW